MPFSRSLRLAVYCSLASVLGCGTSPPPTAEVTGTIKIKGKAPNLEGLEIAFLTAEGRIITAPVSADGTYTAKVPAGEVQIGFIYSPYVEPGSGRRTKGGPPMPGKASMRKREDKPVVLNPFPDALRDPSTSNLRFTVTLGKQNVFNYDLKL